jgi:hypothetical protein
VVLHDFSDDSGSFSSDDCPFIHCKAKKQYQLHLATKEVPEGLAPARPRGVFWCGYIPVMAKVMVEGEVPLKGGRPN